MFWNIAVVLSFLGLIFLCSYVYVQFFATYVVHVGYCVVSNLTVAYRIAPRRCTSVDPKLKRSLKNNFPDVKSINVCYALDKSCTNCVKPKVTKEKLTVYAVGAILSERGSPVDAQDSLMMRQLGYKVYTFPNMTHAFSASYKVGHLVTLNSAVERVTPVVDEVIAAHNLCAYPRFEFINDSSVLIVVPLTRQISYFVPEVVPLSRYEWYLHSARPLLESEDEDEDHESPLTTAAGLRSADSATLISRHPRALSGRH